MFYGKPRFLMQALKVTKTRFELSKIDVESN